MRLLRWLFGSREPDYEKLLERTNAHIRIERAGGDVIEITPNAIARQKGGNGQPKQQPRQNGDGQRLNSQNDRDTQLFRR